MRRNQSGHKHNGLLMAALVDHEKLLKHVTSLIVIHNGLFLKKRT